MRNPCLIQWGQAQLQEWGLIGNKVCGLDIPQSLTEHGTVRVYVYEEELFLGGGMEDLRWDRWTQWKSPSSLAATGVMIITMEGPCHLGESGEGRWSGGDKGTWSPMLTGSRQETVCGHGRWWSAKFHRREWRWQSNGVSRWSGRGEHLGERPGVRTRWGEVTWGELIAWKDPEIVSPNQGKVPMTA